MNNHALAGNPVQALEKVRDWLANASSRELPSAGRTSQEYNAFQANLPALAAHLEFDPERIPYVDYERVVASWLLEAPAPAA